MEDTEQLLAEYYKNNGKKLRRMVDSILCKFGGLRQMDKDDFYSLANEVFCKALERYDGNRCFDGFLYSCLRKRIHTEITKRNRLKRQGDYCCVSIDAPAGEDGSAALAEMIPSSFDLDRELAERLGISEEDRMEVYLGKLSEIQREIVTLLSDGYIGTEIRKMLAISPKTYKDCLCGIQAYENIKVLL